MWCLLHGIRWDRKIPMFYSVLGNNSTVALWSPQPCSVAGIEDLHLEISGYPVSGSMQIKFIQNLEFRIPFVYIEFILEVPGGLLGANYLFSSSGFVSSCLLRLALYYKLQSLLGGTGHQPSPYCLTHSYTINFFLMRPGFGVYLLQL